MGLFILLGTDNPQLRQRVLEALEYGLRERYAEAQALLAEVKRAYPQHPLPPLMEAALWDLYMEDWGTDSKEKAFFSALKEARKRAGREIKLAERAGNLRRLAWAHFYMGAAYAFEAFRYARKGSPKALIPALRGVDHLSKAIEADSTLYDAYYPLGLYDYLIANPPRKLSWIPFLPDPEERKEKGIEELRLAAERGVYTKDLARYSLAWVLMRERQYKEALALAEDLLKRYPESMMFRWLLGYMYRKRGRWSAVERIYSELFHLLVQNRVQSVSLIAKAAYWAAHAKFYTRKYDEALEFARFTLSLLEDMPDTKANRRMRDNILRLIGRLERRVKKDADSGAPR